MKESPYIIQIHHVGGRDGELGEFPRNPNFNEDIVYHIYDPDESCLPQISVISQKRGLNFKLHPYVVDKEEGNIEFQLNHCPCTSSLLPPADYRPEQYSPSALMGDYVYREAFRPVASISAPSVTLDQLAKREQFTVDFLSVDTQGGEERVFLGAEEQLSNHTIGVLCEVEFHELYKDQPLFGDIHARMRAMGFHFIRFFGREAQVNFFRAGIGFRGEGMQMAADALFLKDPESLEKTVRNPKVSLIKLAFIALSFGYLEYALDCLRRVVDSSGSFGIDPEKSPVYVEFLEELWRIYQSTPYIPQPSFAELYNVEEAQRRFHPSNPHAWTTFDRDRVIKNYLAKLDVAAFELYISNMLKPDDTEIEALFRVYGTVSVLNIVKEKRIKHATMVVESLKLGSKVDGEFQLRINEELKRLKIV